MAVVLNGLYTVEVNRQYLPLVNVKAHTTIVSSSASTRLMQTFVNSSNMLLRELKYCFPLYEGVSVVAFTARIGDRTIIGEVKEREKAKLDYNTAVAQGQRAALFEQSLAASDVFTTSIGNVPAGATVDVDITYVGELKHDAGVDGTRLTIPARVLPRYGSHMVSLLPLASSLPSGTMDIVVDVTLPRQNSIQKIQSPSHPISVTLGTTSVAPNAEPALSKASATLALGSVGLDQDFILQVVAKDTGVPTAVLETHPTIPNHRALMATLVPRFALPLEHPEIVFVIDRSGSMQVKPMELAKSALKVFLKSLPVGVKFNICSFGSHHSFLWERSMPYTHETLEEALRHVSVMSSNYGGTEMLQPLKKTIEIRFNDMPLEIMLLTDGEIWTQDQLFNYLNEQVAAATSPLRVFTLGVGSGVSHALIEGVAKAGRGFSQAVSDGEKMDGKIVRMLKGALSPHITDYTLKVKYTSTAAMDGEQTSSTDDELELVECVEEYLKIGDGSGAKNRPETPKKSISLFDTSVDLDGDISMHNDATDSTGQGRYAHLPPLSPPRLLQVPSEIPPLYVFNRTTVYLLMGPECSHRTPKSVILRGTSKHGPLELEIPIQVLEEKGELVHQLAAKKAIAELEQGRGWLKYARDRFTDERLGSKYEGRFGEMVEREAVRLGVQFQVGGKWCSFVAVEKKDGDTGKKKKRERQQQKAKSKDKATEDRAPGPNITSDGIFSSASQLQPDLNLPSAFSPGTLGGFGSTAPPSQSAFGGFGSTAPPSQSAFGGFGSTAPPSQSAFGGFGSTAPPSQSAPGGFGSAASASSQSTFGGFRSAAPSSQSTSGGFGSATLSAQSKNRSLRSPRIAKAYGDNSVCPPPPPAPSSVDPALSTSFGSAAAPKSKFSLDGKIEGRRSSLTRPSPATPPAKQLPLLETLIDLQTFSGFWEMTSELATAVGISLTVLKTEGADLGYNTDEELRILATALAISYFENTLAKDRDTWELVVDKAKGWLLTALQGNQDKMDELFVKAAGLFP
ncbi:von Willebrand factor type A domain-containing protein [Linnemannia elongata]|nr:von Willebrand factor type A domain-containing protein [Linnemannia elongata]